MTNEDGITYDDFTGKRINPGAYSLIQWKKVVDIMRADCRADTYVIAEAVGLSPNAVVCVKRDIFKLGVLREQN